MVAGVGINRNLRARTRPAVARRRAAVAVQIAVSLTVIIGFAALTVDVGAMYNAKAELQRTADAAALAAAGMLGEYGLVDPMDAARDAALEFANQNTVWGQSMLIDRDKDITLGRAHYDAQQNKYSFAATDSLPDAVRVRVRMTNDSMNGPLALVFAGIFGSNHTELTAEAIAMMVPRDIAIVADLSGSMNDDCELRNVHNHQICLFDVWAGLPKSKGQAGIYAGSDPLEPGDPGPGDLHPATGPGLPGHYGGNPNPFNEAFDDSEDHGPRWGWMTTWGTDLLPGTYDPVADTGLYHLPRYQDTTDPEVEQNLIEAGYSAAERDAILSSANDSSTTYYRNRVKVMLGLAGWHSGMTAGKYSSGPGNGNSIIGDGELVQTVDYPFSGGSWNDYVNYVKGNSSMTSGDSGFKYRFGIKTYVNYLLERKPQHSQTAELSLTPAQPVHAVKEAVQHMVDVIHALETLDQVSLEVYGQTVHHEQDLTTEYFDVSDRLLDMQAGYYDTWTNMGGGIAQGVAELTGPRARSASRKIMILLTDGQANVNESGGCGDYTGGKAYALAQAQVAADAGIRIFAVSHGYGADQYTMAQIAETAEGEHYHAEGSIEEYSEELESIFQLLGGQRPVELIK